MEAGRGIEAPEPFEPSFQNSRRLSAIFAADITLPDEIASGNGIDVPNQRILRDIYWKGSFAINSLLGWEERVLTQTLHPAVFQHGKIFAGGSFWKRFDQVANGVATGEVVNYNLECLPGDPEVRAVSYPDDKRAYLRKDQLILLLHYRNAPYQLVYDTIKIIHQNNAVGVMHIGDFPNGLEFATFVLARYNDPFELATDDDQKLIAAATTADPANNSPAFF